MTYIDPNAPNRFRKKGYKGHAKNPSKKPNWFYPPEMTNRERNEWRRERRQKLREQEAQNDNGTTTR